MIVIRSLIWLIILVRIFQTVVREGRSASCSLGASLCVSVLPHVEQLLPGFAEPIAYQEILRF